MSYGLRDGRRVRGVGTFRVRGYGLRGFGDVAAPGSVLVATPAYANCDPRDTACTIANQNLSNQYNLDVQQAQATNNLQQCYDNANNATSDQQRQEVLASCGAQYAIQGGSPASAPVFTGGPGSVPFAPAPSGGQVSFSSSRGGNALQVGDSWTVSITGASPGSSVTVSGSMPGSGSYGPTVMGRTDGTGSFSKTGTADSSTVGNWSESWAVGGVPSGSFNFSVSPVPAAPSGAPAATPGISLPAVNVPVPAVSTAGFDFSSIPWWGWAAGAGVAVLGFSGKGGR